MARSVISFVKLPHGKIVAKSKMSFDSDQAKMAQDIFDNSYELRGMVESIMDDNKTAIFELISPFNQIVLPYNETELRLLQIRDNTTGEYASTSLMHSYLKLYDLQKMMAEEFEVHEYTWDKLLELQQTEQNIEGWIVTLEDGQMLKCKTRWYFSAHHLTTDNVTRENLLLELVLTDKLDDVLCVVQGEKKKYLEEMSAKIQHYFNHKVTEYKSLRGLYFNKFQEDRKEFAMKHKNHELFNAVMKTLNTSFRDIEDTAKKAVKDYLLKKYNTLTSAKEFLNSLASE
jgi:RNA ligase